MLPTKMLIPCLGLIATLSCGAGDALSIESLGADLSHMTSSDSVTFTATMSGTGSGSVLLGTLVDDAERHYGDFSAVDERTFVLSIDWSTINSVSPIDAPMGGTPREFTAVFTDADGSQVRRSVSVAMECAQDASWGLCAGSCANIDSDLNHCGTCDNSCPEASGVHQSGICLEAQCAIGCEPGFIDRDGTCVRAQWKFEKVANVGNSDGSFIDAALDRNGVLHSLFHDPADTSLQHARRIDGQWQVIAVDSEGQVGRAASLALDTQGAAHASYAEYADNSLRYAYFDGSTWTPTTVKDDGRFAGNTSIAVDANARPHIAYTDIDDNNLMYAFHDGNAWQVDTVDDADNVGGWVQIAIDNQDRPHLAYRDTGAGAVRYATPSSSGGWSIETVDDEQGAGWFISLALDRTGRPHIAHYRLTGASLHYATRLDDGTWSIQQVDEGSSVGVAASLSIDDSGEPHIAYYDLTLNLLKYAHRHGETWYVEQVTEGEDLGGGASMVLDNEGIPHLLFREFDAGEIWHATTE